MKTTVIRLNWIRLGIGFLMCLFLALPQMGNAKKNNTIDLSPALLLSNMAPNLSIEQQKERLRITKILQPFVDDNNHLKFKCTKELAERKKTLPYYSYAIEYAQLYNKFVDKLKDEGQTPHFTGVEDVERIIELTEGLILSDFLSQNDDDLTAGYSLNLSMKDARKIGISEAQYKDEIQSINISNEFIAEVVAKGEKIHIAKLSNPRKIAPFDIVVVEGFYTLQRENYAHEEDFQAESRRIRKKVIVYYKSFKTDFEKLNSNHKNS